MITRFAPPKRGTSVVGSPPFIQAFVQFTNHSYSQRKLSRSPARRACRPRAWVRGDGKFPIPTLASRLRCWAAILAIRRRTPQTVDDLPSPIWELPSHTIAARLRSLIIHGGKYEQLGVVSSPIAVSSPRYGGGNRPGTQVSIQNCKSPDTSSANLWSF
jgi:hypothetical protein